MYPGHIFSILLPGSSLAMCVDLLLLVPHLTSMVASATAVDPNQTSATFSAVSSAFLVLLTPHIPDLD